MSTPKTVLVVGANRGIGKQLATRFLNNNGNYIVYGTVRPETKTDPSVHQLGAKGGKILELDLLDENTINQAARDFGHHQPLDILINVAGLYYLWDDKPFSEQSAEDLMQHFKVNVVGPFMVSKAFLPSLTLSPSAKIINISSDFASIAGGNASYRISKASLNQLTKNMAIDLEKKGSSNIKTLAIHPGYVATKMTGYFGEDDMETCMSSLIGVIERFGTEDGVGLPNGGFVRWDGEVMAY